ncbi:MAG: winged helix-turn-helix transcriptional regulator [Nitrospirae bacterium]|nr:winged helix-turn-helix transcriptional regulator [Nitrospirota bacterium]
MFYVIVQNMNNIATSEKSSSLQILVELSANDSLTQRDLSNSLGIALGLVNSYVRNLMTKGFITVKAIPRRRYAYYLTPKGFAEKTRLVYDLLQDYTRIYQEARSNLKGLFAELSSDGIKRVIFAGADEVAEIAYLTLLETDIELSGVIDEEMAGNKFFGKEINSSAAIGNMAYDCIVVTSYLKREKIYKKLISSKVRKEDIKVIFPV